jgi:hypothetical protein
MAKKAAPKKKATAAKASSKTEDFRAKSPDELGTQLFGAAVAEIGNLTVVVTRIDHQQWVRDATTVRCVLLAAKSLFSALEHDQGIFAA